MADSRHRLTWILTCIWGLYNSAINTDCHIICWIYEVKSNHPTNKVSQNPFSESSAASCEANRVWGNRSSGQQSSLCILQLLDIFITVFIEVTLKGWKKTSHEGRIVVFSRWQTFRRSSILQQRSQRNSFLINSWSWTHFVFRGLCRSCSFGKLWTVSYWHCS